MSLNSFYHQLYHFQEKQLAVTFLWDRMMDFHSLSLRFAILKFLCKSNFFMARTDFFGRIFSIFFEFLGFLAWKR